MINRAFLLFFLALSAASCSPALKSAGSASGWLALDPYHPVTDSIVLALAALGYDGDGPGRGTQRGAPTSMHSDMIWEGGLRFTQSPEGTAMAYYLRRELSCPDSLKASISACVLRNVIPVAVASPPAADADSIVLVARSVVGPRDGPIRPWPTIAAVRADADRVARRFGSRCVVAESLDVPH